MACILKLPTKNSKGIVTFTDLERDQFLSKNKVLQSKILSLKKNWLVGMHHNWTRFDSESNYIFDFAMYLKDNYYGKLPLIPFAACNFAPEFFTPTDSEKFWDVLFVARAVRFKNIPEFLLSIRRLYDSGKQYRILFICPIPSYKWIDRKTTFYNIRKTYNKMFSEKEQDSFTLLTTNYRDPFPFDLKTLSYFYKSSRIFVHSSNKEKQGRTMGYAWACGMPIVGLQCIGTPLPDKYKIKPYFYKAEKYDDFPTLIEEAIETSKNEELQKSNWPELTKLFSETKTLNELITEIKKLFLSKNLVYGNGDEFFKNLGIRLGRHHKIALGNSNTTMMSLCTFVDLLNDKISTIRDLIYNEDDPESALAILFPTKINKLNHILRYFR